MHIKNYKRIYLVIVSTLLLVFASCRSIYQKYEYYDSHCGIVSKSSGGVCYQIYSAEEKAEFLNSYDLSTQFYDMVNQYDKNYFSSQYLAILVMPRSSSTVRYDLRKIKINDNIEFEIKIKTKKIATEDLVNKAFIVELSKDLSDKACEILLIK